MLWGEYTATQRRSLLLACKPQKTKEKMKRKQAGSQGVWYGMYNFDEQMSQSSIFPGLSVCLLRPPASTSTPLHSHMDRCAKQEII